MAEPKEIIVMWQKYDKGKVWPSILAIQLCHSVTPRGNNRNTQQKEVLLVP